jgi:hypothetical protein
MKELAWYLLLLVIDVLAALPIAITNVYFGIGRALVVALVEILLVLLFVRC